MELDLSNNNICGDIGSFPSFPKHLRYLNLSSNKELFGVLDFKGKLFAHCNNNIKEIIMEDCSISRVDNFDFMPKTLNELKLNENEIEMNIEDILCFKDKYFSIKSMDLSSNIIFGTFRFEITTWPHLLSVMDLSGNVLKADIDLQSWPDCLIALDLRDNKINNIDIQNSKLMYEQHWKFDGFHYQNDMLP